MQCRIPSLLLLLAAGTAVSLCGENTPSVVRVAALPPVVLSGNARIDFVGQLSLNDGSHLQEIVAETPAHKSPWLAAGLSAILPGAGEFYAESYLKSALFLVAEAALWTIAYTYDKKGDRQTDYFQDYADAHWSVVQYGEYAQSHMSPPHGPYQWLIPGTEGHLPWERVNWTELNRMEQDIAGYYSHILPPHGQQQYFELIGKYPQYNQGWDDAPPTFNYGDPLTANFQYYSTERGKANDYYATASTFVAIAVVNHVVSAIDAAVTAGAYNKGLHASVGTQTIPVLGGLTTVPALRLSYKL